MDPGAKTELEEKLRRLLRVGDESAQDELHAEIGRLSPDPDWSDHVFQSNESTMVRKTSISRE
ncbi:hypothetical protein ACBY01_01395 [Sphingomonas sp. ac-8]|uniref:hypothetical protein n=1 Tax=Sphingomonas sp. ac-8 TaxID=3242977 RepID=UPI003A809F23